MRGFISWAKDERSRVVAEALRVWLPDLFHSLDLWSSSTDIRAGVRWSEEVADALSKAEIGIVCVTSLNQSEPWLLFEAGSLAKALPRTFVCPYLIHMRPTDLRPGGPLTQFQSKMATREGTWDLVSTINSALGDDALPQDRLERNFDRSWPTLDTKLASLAPVAVPIQLSQTDLLKEILEAVRSIPRRQPSSASKSSKTSARLSRSKQVDRVVAFLDRTGHMDATRPADVRRHLAQMPPLELASVDRLVRESTAKTSNASDDAILSIMTKIGTPWLVSGLSIGNEARDDA